MVSLGNESGWGLTPHIMACSLVDSQQAYNPWRAAGGMPEEEHTSSPVLVDQPANTTLLLSPATIETLACQEAEGWVSSHLTVISLPLTMQDTNEQAGKPVYPTCLALATASSMPT